VLLLAALLGTIVVGASLLARRQNLETTVVSTPRPAVGVVIESIVPEVSPLPSTVPDASPATSPAFTPLPNPAVATMPAPKCPSPSKQVPPPVVSASVGTGQVVATTRGSYTTMTCSTTGTSDAVPGAPVDSLAAYPGDKVRFTVPVGWRFARWEGSHKPIDGAGAPVAWEPADMPDRPRSIELPGPLLLDETVSLTVVLVSDDERTVIDLELQLLLNQAVS
jgi:hypothetical protein